MNWNTRFNDESFHMFHCSSLVKWRGGKVNWSTVLKDLLRFFLNIRVLNFITLPEDLFSFGLSIIKIQCLFFHLIKIIIIYLQDDFFIILSPEKKHSHWISLWIEMIVSLSKYRITITTIWNVFFYILENSITNFLVHKKLYYFIALVFYFIRELRKTPLQSGYIYMYFLYDPFKQIIKTV